MHALLGRKRRGQKHAGQVHHGLLPADGGPDDPGVSKQVLIHNPRDALALGIGMVYQHFTLVQNMTVAENMVLSRGEIPARIDWVKEYEQLRAFMRTTPFFIDITRKVASLSAGEKQKLEICKQLVS